MRRLQAGSALYIGNGSYAETVKPLISGTAQAPITITSWPGRSPVIGNGLANGAYISAKSYITLSNLTFTATTGDGIYVTKSDHITISGNTVTNTGRQAQGATAPGVSIRATNFSVVSNNNTHHNSDTGIYVTNTSTGDTITNNESSYNAQGWQRNANGINITSPGNTIIGNVTHDNEDTGVQLYTGANNNLVALNVTYNNGDHGIDNLNVTGGTVIGNTVFRNCTSGINLEGDNVGQLPDRQQHRRGQRRLSRVRRHCMRAPRRQHRRLGRLAELHAGRPQPGQPQQVRRHVRVGQRRTRTLTAMQKATGQEAAGVQADPKFVDPTSWNLLLQGRITCDRPRRQRRARRATADILGYPRVRDPNVSNAFATGPRLFDDLGAYEYQPNIVPAPIQAPIADLTLDTQPGNRAPGRDAPTRPPPPTRKARP